MPSKKPKFLALAFGLCLYHSAVGAPVSFPTQPYPEVHYEYRVSANPAEQIHIVRVDLTDPDVDVRVSQGGADPDGDGPYQTTLQTPPTIAAREHFEVTVNGDFFEAQKTADVEGAQSGYVAGKWAKVLGPAVTDGFLWGPAAQPRPAFILDDKQHARIATIQDVPPDARQVIAGSHVLLQDGQNVAAKESKFALTRHPRTALGIADEGKTLVLVVVDGRRAGESEGMSLTELADLMRQLGCSDALNLDGGGSSELLLRNPQNGQLQVLNRPSDGRERAVANVLGISIRGSRRVNAPVSLPVKVEEPKVLGP